MEKYIAFWTFDDVEQEAISREFGIRVLTRDPGFIAAWIKANLYTEIARLELFMRKNRR